MSSTKYQKGISESVDSVFDEDQQQEVTDDGVYDSEEKIDADAEARMEIIASVFPLCGGRKPFSAIRGRLLPKYFEQPEELFDEFGFRLPDFDGSVDPTAEQMPLESSSQRMHWLALIQNTHSQVEEALTWGKVDSKRVQTTTRFEEMLFQEGGIPHSLRPFLWPVLCGASEKRSKSPFVYVKIVSKSEKDGAPSVNVQIEKDLLRTLPSHYSFSKAHSPGIGPLRRVLRALAFLFPELGYCQGMGLVVGDLLLVCCEENVFWIMCCLIEDLLPSAYYSPSLLGVRVDERLLRHLVQVHMPELTELMHDLNADISMVIANWLITLLASAFPPRTLFRIWDWLFALGSAVLFRIILAMLKLNEEKLLERWRNAKSSTSSDPGSELFAAISKLSSEISRVEDLLEMAHSFEFSVTDHLIKELRRKYQAVIISGTQSTPMDVIIDHEDGSLNEGTVKQKVTRRRFHRTTSVVHRIFQQQHQEKDDNENEEDPRRKNIRQTELLLDLRNAIIQICAHFSECNEPEHCERQISTQADYSLGFDSIKEQEGFFNTRSEVGGQKKARALADFEQEDEHDLGFHRNDIIHIVSTEDEHCWIGELNGRSGWFPAKFVQVVGEHCKNYCVKGDEVLSPRIAELVRGAFAFAFRQVLSHGIRQTNRHFGILSSSNAAHPWSFIESVANGLSGTKCAGSIGEKVGHLAENTSRLTLSTTFRLDQDGRVLSPEELLILAIHSINCSHEPANAPLDGKFRSLVVFGLNEQCLHLWFNIFCHSIGQDVLRKRYYYSWSFIRSPASQQICCELKLLMQFGFNFNVDSEIIYAEELKTTAASSTNKQNLDEIKDNGDKKGLLRNGIPLKEGVRDLLIKHHLFSWDI